MKKYNFINFGYNPWSFYWKRNQTIFYLLTREDLIDQALFINTPVWLVRFHTRPKTGIGSAPYK